MACSVEVKVAYDPVRVCWMFLVRGCGLEAHNGCYYSSSDPWASRDDAVASAEWYFGRIGLAVRFDNTVITGVFASADWLEGSTH